MPRLNKDLEFQRTLGRGNFGEVYLAWYKQLGCDVAVKVLQYTRRLDPDVRNMFLKEAGLLLKLNHSSLVRVHELFELDDGRIAIVMDYCDGGTLHDLRKSWPSGRPNISTILEILEQVAKAVHYVHTATNDRATLVHRDLTPTNILFDTNKRPHVADFGLAALTTGPLDSRERPGGTPAYMSPEQVRQFRGQGSSVDSRTDVWSLGVILYEMITGTLPFNGSREKIMDDIADPNIPCVAPKDLNHETPSRLDEIVRQCLVKDPNGRFQTAEELADALHRCRRNERQSNVDMDDTVIELIDSGLLRTAAYGVLNDGPIRKSIIIRLVKMLIADYSCLLAARLVERFRLTNEFPPKDLVHRMRCQGHNRAAAHWAKRFRIAGYGPSE